MTEGTIIVLIAIFSALLWVTLEISRIAETLKEIKELLKERIEEE